MSPSSATATAADTAASPTTAPSARRPVVLLAAAIIVALYIVPLGWFGLNKPDEGRYAEIGREMLVTGDWLTPHLDFVKYFEKPPLVYWATAVAEATFGPKEFAVRLFPALCGLLTLWLTFVLARSMFGPGIGGFSAVLLATSPLFFFLSQVLILDMPLTASITVALVAFWFGYRDEARRTFWYRIMYAAVGVGVLIKGPIAIILPGLTIFLFLLVQRDWSAMLDGFRLDGIAIAALIAVPWYIAVSIRNPEFPHFFFVEQNFVRYTSTHEHHGGWWYYFPIIFGAMIPWTLMALADPKSWWPKSWRAPRPEVTFLALWSASIFLFFSFSISKLGTYVLPMFAPLAILLALALRRQVDAGRPLGLTVCAWAIGILGVVSVVSSPFVWYFWSDARSGLLASRLLVGGAFLAGSGTLLHWQVRGGHLRRSLWLTAAVMAVFLAVAISARDVATEYRQLARVVAANVRPDDVVVTYGNYMQSVSFYARVRTVNVIGWGELEFGRKQGDNSAFFWRTDQQLFDAWKGPKRILLLIDEKDLERLRPRFSPPPIEIARQYKKVLVTNRR